MTETKEVLGHWGLPAPYRHAKTAKPVALISGSSRHMPQPHIKLRCEAHKRVVKILFSQDRLTSPLYQTLGPRCKRKPRPGTATY